MGFVRRTALVAALFLIPGAGAAETISGAMAKAYQNNPDLNAARAGLRAIDESVTIAKAGYWPQVAATSNASVISLSDLNSGLPSQQYNTASVGISITQQIFDGFQTLNKVRASESRVFAGRESLKPNEISILLAAAEGYANVARESLVSSQRDAVVARYSVIAAMGRLTVASQELQVAQYRSEEHYEAVKDKWFGLRTIDGR